MTIGAQFATRNEVEQLRRKLTLAISGKNLISVNEYDLIAPPIAFLNLTDVPVSYAAAGNWVVRVKSTVDALEFADLKGTTNQVTVTENAADFTLSLPQDIHTGASPTFVTVKLSALTDGYVPYHVSDATGLANSVIRTDGTLVGVGMLPTVAQLEVNTSQIITSTTAAPYLKLINLSDTERDPIIQFAVGATPVTKWTHGLDDSDGDKWKLAVGDEFGDDHDTIVVTSGEGLTPAVAEFTLIDTWQTPISGASENPNGVCTDGTYIYYTVYNPGAIVKIDPVTGTEVTRNTPASHIFSQSVCDGTYIYVIRLGSGVVCIEKYACSDLAYVSATDVIPEAINALFYWSGHLYVTDDSNGIRKVRCSDMSLIWRVSFPVGDPHECWPSGITTDGTYLYVLDDRTNGIIRLNMDGTFVDLTAVANPMQNGSLWISGQYLYVGIDTSRVEKINKGDLSIDVLFTVAASAIGQAFQYNDYHYLLSDDDTCIYKYTSTSMEEAGSSYLQIRLRDIYGQMFDIARFVGGGARFGVGTTIPTETIEAAGNIKAMAGQFISTKATGTAPVVVSSTTVCTNLNSDLVDGYHHNQSLLTTAGPTFDHLHLTNDLAVADGGTNKSAWTLYAIPYASGVTTIGEIAIGTAGKVLAVNGTANGYEWIPAGGAIAFADLTDYPADAAGVLTNDGAGALSWEAASGGGGDFLVCQVFS